MDPILFRVDDACPGHPRRQGEAQEDGEVSGQQRRQTRFPFILVPLFQLLQRLRLQGLLGERLLLQPEAERGEEDAHPLHRRADGRGAEALRQPEAQEAEDAAGRAPQGGRAARAGPLVPKEGLEEEELPVPQVLHAAARRRGGRRGAWRRPRGLRLAGGRRQGRGVRPGVGDARHQPDREPVAVLGSPRLCPRRTRWHPAWRRGHGRPLGGGGGKGGREEQRECHCWQLEKAEDSSFATHVNLFFVLLQSEWGFYEDEMFDDDHGHHENSDSDYDFEDYSSKKKKSKSKGGKAKGVRVIENTSQYLNQIMKKKTRFSSIRGPRAAPAPPPSAAPTQTQSRIRRSPLPANVSAKKYIALHQFPPLLYSSSFSRCRMSKKRPPKKSWGSSQFGVDL